MEDLIKIIINIKLTLLRSKVLAALLKAVLNKVKPWASELLVIGQTIEVMLLQSLQMSKKYQENSLLHYKAH